MDTMLKAMTLQDILNGMETNITTWLAKSTMTRQQIAERIVEKAENQAFAFREQARMMRAQTLNIKDAQDHRTSRLEQFEADVQHRIDLGGEFTAKKNALLAAGKTEDDDEVRALTLQISQVAKALSTLRANAEFVTLKGSYETASHAYELAKENARQAEATALSLRQSLPALVQALEVYETTKAMAADQARQKVQPFSAQGFLTDIQGDISAAQHDVRAAEDVDRDLTPEAPNDPVADMLAAREAQHADASVLAEFEAAAAKK